MSVLGRDVDDTHKIDLIRNLLLVDIFERDGHGRNYTNSDICIPQGSPHVACTDEDIQAGLFSRGLRLTCLRSLRYADDLLLALLPENSTEGESQASSQNRRSHPRALYSVRY